MELSNGRLLKDAFPGFSPPNKKGLVSKYSVCCVPQFFEVRVFTRPEHQKAAGTIFKKYVSPAGKQYLTLKDAVANGYDASKAVIVKES